MTTIGLIGSGHIGGTVARLAVAAGYDVVVSNSRGPETLRELVGELGPRARAATAAEAAAAGDIVVVSVPFKAYQAVPAEPLAGKVVIDTNNYYPQRDGQFAELDDASATCSELLQRHLAGAQVVKVFNNIFFKHLGSLARPAGAADRTALPIAGDDAAAKATVDRVPGRHRLRRRRRGHARRQLALPAGHARLRLAVRRVQRPGRHARRRRDDPHGGSQSASLTPEAQR